MTEQQQTLTEPSESNAPAPAGAKKSIHPFGKKRRWKKAVLALAVLAAAGLGIQHFRGGSSEPEALPGYTVDTVQRRDLTTTVEGSATLEPADAYQVTTLLSGEILTAPFEQDGQVAKDAVLYTLDSSDARDSVNRAGISVEQAQLGVQQAQEALHPTATISGTIGEVFVHDGDNVTAGTALATVVGSTDLTMDFLFPYASTGDFYVGQSATVFIGDFDGSVTGRVVSVSDGSTITSNAMKACSVRVKVTNPGVVSTSFSASAVIGSYTSYGSAAVSMGASATVYASGSGTVTGFSRLAGSTVKQGDVLCTIESESTHSQLKTAQLNLESARLSAGSAAGSLQDYTIKSPIAGTVIEKKFKAGDKVDGASSGTLAVIYDLSSLKMEMNVNELDIGKVAVGQTVDITANALPGQVFTGVVERVSINGSTTNGFTTYPVTISVQDYGDLKPGMNVSTVIHCETVRDVLTVPVGAVVRGGTVQLPTPAAMTADGSAVVDPSQLESRAVTLGRSDDEYIEVTSGLEEGDQVICPADGSGGDDASSSAQLIG